MKKLLFLSTVVFTVLSACAQNSKSPHETVKGKDVMVDYGRPYKKGRVIFGDLVPYGKVWRTGADSATHITFTKDAMVAGQPVKAGTYSLFTIPAETEWTIILNSERKQWGAYSYDKHKDKDVLQVKVPAKKTDKLIEQHTIRFNDTGMVIEWDQTQVEVPISMN